MKPMILEYFKDEDFMLMLDDEEKEDMIDLVEALHLGCQK